MSDEEKMQELYMEYQNLSSSVKELEKQKQALDNQVTELTQTSESLDDIKKVKAGTQILVPVSTGIYAKAELEEAKNLIVNVGANVALKKDVNSTKKLVDKQIEEVNKLKENVDKELQDKGAKVAVLEKQINEMVSKHQQGSSQKNV